MVICDKCRSPIADAASVVIRASMAVEAPCERGGVSRAQVAARSAARPARQPRRGETRMKIKSPIGYLVSSCAWGLRIRSVRAAAGTPAVHDVPGVAAGRCLLRAVALVIALGAPSAAHLGATLQAVPSSCFEESAPIPGCTACNLTIPPSVPCAPNDCPPTVLQSFRTEAVPVPSGGRQQRSKAGMHECSITCFRCEQGVCIEDYTRSWTVQRLIPSGATCP